MKRKWTALLLSVAMMAAAVAGSVQAEEAQEKVENNLNETQELVLCSVRDIAPGPEEAFYCSPNAYVWEALTYDHDGVIEPWLAKSWEHNKDCTEWTFYLRDDVDFTDGVHFDADVCIKNIERYKCDLTTNYTSLKLERSFPNLDQMTAVDEYTVKFTFTEPVTTLEYLVSNYGSPMISPNCFDAETGAYTSTIVGTGRYVIAERVPDEYTILERNPDYYGENPGTVKTIRVVRIEDADTRYSALVSEEVFGLMDNGSLSTAAAQELVSSDDRFQYDVTPSHMLHWMGISSKSPYSEYLSDVRLRQAISYAIDRELVNETLFGDLLKPAYSVLSWQSAMFKDIQGEYDLEKAKTLAQEVLGDETITLRLLVSQAKAQNYPVKALAEYLQAILPEIGINIEIEMLEHSVFTERLNEGDYDLCLHVTSLSSTDPYEALRQYLQTDAGWNASYCFGYSNSHVDELLEEVHKEAEPEARKAIYDEIQDIAAEELPMIPLLHDVNLNIYNTKISNYTSDVFSGVSLPTISWVQE